MENIPYHITVDSNGISEMVSDLPFEITKGLDEYEAMRDNYWCVDYRLNEGYDFRSYLLEKDLVPRFFKTPEKAYDFAKKTYRKWLQLELQKIKD